MSALDSLITLGANIGKSFLAMSIVHALYYPFFWVFDHYNESFRQLSDMQRLYSVKNGVKTIVLALCTPMALFVLYERVFSDHYTCVPWIRTSGRLYSACDIVALAKMKRKLPFSTQIHHTMVLLFSVINLVVDYNQWDNPWSNLAVVASTSCLSYSVNYYLSVRKQTEHVRKVAQVGLVTYLPTFLFAVTFNLCTVDVTTFHGALFMCFMLPVWYDDCILLRHLWRRAR